LVELDNEPRQVHIPGDAAAGADGELHAMMLDMKRTFDDVVAAHSTPERAQAILDNPFYQALSSSFSGTQEYMAMEKLGQLRASDQWDLIIVDTPPSRSALDFLDAPNRMSRFLDGTMIRLLTAPSRTGLKIASAGFMFFSRIISKILGGQLLRDISAFVAALDTMFGGFRERATATYELLRRPGTWFVVVATPEPDALREASYFVDRLSSEGMPLAGLVLNRTHPPATTVLSATRAEGAAEEVADAGGPGAEIAAAALRVHAERMALAGREQHLADRFTSAHPEVAVRTVPATAGDVHDLDGLRVMGEELTGPDGDTPTGTPRTRVLPARRG
ncbi:ArsA family ATPase, partial [Blastococcus sp. CT_GayMR20]|uniref:ArsA family ATPase n=1 Tax=Blastococcus sp. CT_GayMR20 TaxID=2559609 RepID=UPI001073F882